MGKLKAEKLSGKHAAGGQMVASEPAAARLQALQASDARQGFFSGVAASIALLGFAGVSGYLALPSFAGDAIPAPVSVASAAVPVTVSYAEPVGAAPSASLDGLVAARFGDDLRVSFAPQASQSASQSGARPANAPAAPETGDSARAAEAATPTTIAVASVATVDTVELPFGQPVLADDLRGVMPAFITDVVVEEPIER